MLYPSNRLRAPLAAVLILFGVSAVQAADKPAFSVSGYGTLAAVHSDSNHADYAGSILKANGAGATRDVSFDVDSRLATQFELTQDKWSAVLQLVSEQGSDNSYRPFVEWGNVKYQATTDLALRAGRIALPMFLGADYRRVGFAHPWVRPPVELYGTIPITNSDGVDATYRWTLGGATHQTQVFAGGTKVDFDENTTATVRKLAGFAHTVHHGAFTARLSALRANVTLGLARPLFDAYRQFGPAGVAIAERYDADGKRADAVSVGLNYDPGQWFATGEIGRLNTRSYIGDKTAFYVSTGYRAGSVTAYTTFASSRPNMDTTDRGLPLEGMPAQQAAIGAALNHGLDELLRYVANQRTASAGVRWDVADNVSLTLQHDRVKTRGTSYGTLIRIQPGYQAGRPIGVTSLSVDFVF